MSWTRGERSVEVELSRVQDWIETNDKALNGDNGDKGVIREHRDAVAERRAFVTFAKFAMGVTAGFGSLAGLLTVLQVLHIIPR